MVVANKTSRFVWMYQAAVGTSQITAVDSPSYEFGGYNEETGKWNGPYVENPVEEYWIYSARTPKLTDLETKYPTFKHAFLPFTAQFLNWMLGSATDSDPEVLLTALNSGMPVPITIRLEELEGSANVPQNANAVDCYSVGLTMKAERGTSFLVQSEFAFGSLEDIGDNPNLTTSPLAPGNVSGPYDGNPYVMWDIDGDNVNLPGVWRADIRCEAVKESVSSDEGTVNTTYVYKLKPVQIVLSAVFETNDSWDDYVDRKASTNMSIKVTKHDGTSYLLLTFTNARIVSIKKTGHRNKGHYGSIMAIIAEKVEGESDWFTEHGGSPTFATYWKAAMS